MQTLKVDFNFKPLDKVKTPMDDCGIVNMAAIDKQRTKQYYVMLSGGNGAWFDEYELRLV